jgi:TonB family protein
MIPAEWRISGPFSNTASAQISRRYFQEIKSFQDYFIGYHFLNELERVPGDWTIELFVKSDKIFSFEFELLPGKCPQQNDCYSEPVNNPDVFPTYVGGDAAMTKFIAENVVYPLEARKRKLEDKVYVKIIINKDGTIGDSEVVIGKYDILNQAALEVFDKMPAWIPGELNGEPVRVPIIIPINFRVI